MNLSDFAEDAMDSSPRAWRESFARFFKTPSREALRELLRTHIGEADTYDFKKDWPALPKVARHVLAFANSGGGVVVFGIEERPDKTFVPIGLGSMMDKADISKGIEKFIPRQLKYEVLDFAYIESEYDVLAGKKFQVLLVEDLPTHTPFISSAASDGIERDTIYVRRGTNSERANYEELQRIINRRIETGYSSQEELDLGKHLSELAALYEAIPRYREKPLFVEASMAMFGRNPAHPKEDIYDFVNKLIERKKQMIEEIITRP